MDSARTRALTVNEIIDERPLGRFQISTIALCGLVLLLDGFDTQCIGFLAPSISESLGIPLKNFGPVFSAGLIGLMIAAMAMGPVADRWGRKWPVVLSALTFAVFALLTARAVSLQQLILFRFLTGLGLGGAMPNRSRLGPGSWPRGLHRRAGYRRDVADDGLDASANISRRNGARALRFDCHPREQSPSRSAELFPRRTRCAPGVNRISS